jgi:hypothetical protein
MIDVVRQRQEGGEGADVAEWIVELDAQRRLTPSWRRDGG